VITTNMIKSLRQLTQMLQTNSSLKRAQSLLGQTLKNLQMKKLKSQRSPISQRH
jgi:type II secretory pathway component PulF